MAVQTPHRSQASSQSYTELASSTRAAFYLRVAVVKSKTVDGITQTLTRRDDAFEN